MEKKKIVYVIGGLYGASGMSRVLSMKANYLAEHAGYEVYVILTERKGVPYFYEMSPKINFVNFDINFDELDTMPFFKKLYHYYGKQRKYKRLFRNYLMGIRPDITVSALRREINFLNSIPDGSKKIGELHFNKSNYRQFHKKYLPDFINRAISDYWTGLLIKEIKKLSRFVVLSNEDRKAWCETKGLRNMQASNNISVISNPLSFFPEKTSECTTKKIIAVGRYSYEKGFDLLIEAGKKIFAEHPDWELNIYGQGNNIVYQQMADRAGIGKNIHCRTAVKNIIEKYQESSIFVLSSRNEGFGMVIAEAMACGVPIVSFACPCGPRDIIKDKEDGILVEPENVKELSKKICYLIEQEELRKEMGENARKNVGRFKIEKIMQQWIELFEEI